jgi:hypothetical protein
MRIGPSWVRVPEGGPVFAPRWRHGIAPAWYCAEAAVAREMSIVAAGVPPMTAP